MDDKTRDSVFAVVLGVFGIYVVAESVRMLGLAAEMPFRIDKFRISPGMFPLFLGVMLLVFAGLLLARALRGEANPWAVFRLRMITTWRCMTAAIHETDFIIMFIGCLMMYFYCFHVLGNVPFIAGAIAFLILLMGFLRLAEPAVDFIRSARLGTLSLISVVSVALISFLFETLFSTVLP